MPAESNKVVTDRRVKNAATELILRLSRRRWWFAGASMSSCCVPLFIASASPPGPSEADWLSHEVRDFSSVPAVPEGLQLTRLSGRESVHQDAKVQCVLDFG